EWLKGVTPSGGCAGSAGTVRSATGAATGGGAAGHPETPTFPPQSAGVAMSPRRLTGLLLATAVAGLVPLTAHGLTPQEEAAAAPPGTAAVPLDELTVTTEQVASGLERPTAI